MPLTSTLSSIRKAPDGKPAAEANAETSAEKQSEAAALPKKPERKGPGRGAILGLLFITAVIVVGAIYVSDNLSGPDTPQPATVESEAAATAAADALTENREGNEATQDEPLSGSTDSAAASTAQPETETASTAPQSEEPLQTSGETGEQVAAVPPPPETDALTAEENLELEQLLAQLDMSPGTVDGTIDSDTEQAIRLYQEFAGLPVDGVPNRMLLLDLRDVARLVPGNNQ